MNEPLISLRQIHKRFEDAGVPVEVLRGLDFEAFAGDYISIRGASGAGKSTLLHLMGLLDKPTSGQVMFRGEELASQGDKHWSQIRNSEIGFVFQFHHLLPDFTAWENVIMPVLIGQKKLNECSAYARELLGIMGMQSRLEHLPSELSGGERQRLALARALVLRPKLLLADEPSGNLDEENAANLNALLLDINKNFGVTVVLVTHDHELYSTASIRYTLHNGVLTKDD